MPVTAINGALTQLTGMNDSIQAANPYAAMPVRMEMASDGSRRRFPANRIPCRYPATKATVAANPAAVKSALRAANPFPFSRPMKYRLMAAPSG